MAESDIIFDSYQSRPVKSGTEIFFHFPRTEPLVNVFCRSSDCDCMNTERFSGNNFSVELFTLLIYLAAYFASKRKQTAHSPPEENE